MEYVRDQINLSFEALKKGINQNLDDAKKKVEEEKVKWQAEIATAQAKLDPRLPIVDPALGRNPRRLSKGHQ